MTKKINIWHIALLCLVMYSCGEDENTVAEEMPVELSTEEKLAGKWMLGAFLFDGAPSQLDSCRLQETYEFKTGTSIEIIRVFSSATDDSCITEVIPATWELVNEALFITEPGGQTKYTILEVSETTLKIETISEFTNPQGQVVQNIFTYTYKKV